MTSSRLCMAVPRMVLPVGSRLTSAFRPLARAALTLLSTWSEGVPQVYNYHMTLVGIPAPALRTVCVRDSGRGEQATTPRCSPSERRREAGSELESYWALPSHRGLCDDEGVWECLTSQVAPPRFELGFLP